MRKTCVIWKATKATTKATTKAITKHRFDHEQNLYIKSVY